MEFDTDRLLGLDLSGKQLSGPIPPELGNLNLNCNSRDSGSGNCILDLSDNEFSGPIPSELSNLNCGGYGCVIDLSGNQLSGPIPPELSNLNLNCYGRDGDGDDGGRGSGCVIDLSGNQLSGPIPSELGNLNLNCYGGDSGLGYGGGGGDCVLDLSGNQLSGPIPPELGNLNLNCYGGDGGRGGGGGGDCVLDFSGNQLSGPIPPELGNLNLNCYGGDAPPGRVGGGYGGDSGNCVLDLSGNQLSGPIPPELPLNCGGGDGGRGGGGGGHCVLDLSGNQLSGPIPPELSYLELGALWVHDNRLSGEIPATLEVGRSFRFCHNRLTGALPVHLRTVATNFSGDVNDISACRESTFRDDNDSAHLADIEQIADWGITRGCALSLFCPSRTVTRAQMAAFLHRAVTRLYGEPSTAGEVQLTDVADDDWYRPSAQWATANNVISAPGGAFNPQGPVSRADTAEMLIAAFDHLTASPELQDLFTDTAGLSAATIRAMEGIHDAGVTTGCETNPLRYCPAKKVTRAQMASFLARAINLANF